MNTDFIQFSIYLDTVKSSDIIVFKKLYNKKLNAYLHSMSQTAVNDLLMMQKSFTDNYSKLK